MEMCKQNNARIEELVMENAKLKSQLSTVEPTSKNYDVREEIHTHHTHTQTGTHPHVVSYHLIAKMHF